MADDPNKLFTKLFFSLAGAPGDVGSLRRIAKFASAEVVLLGYGELPIPREVGSRLLALIFVGSFENGD